MSDNQRPTDDLICELLAARHRLGERIWTLDRNPTVTKALQRLESDGLVNFKHGITENTYLAWLTDAGRAEYVVDSYVAPKLQDIINILERQATIESKHWTDAENEEYRRAGGWSAGAAAVTKMRAEAILKLVTS